MQSQPKWFCTVSVRVNILQYNQRKQILSIFSMINDALQTQMCCNKKPIFKIQYLNHKRYNNLHSIIDRNRHRIDMIGIDYLCWNKNSIKRQQCFIHCTIPLWNSISYRFSFKVFKINPITLATGHHKSGITVIMTMIYSLVHLWCDYIPEMERSSAAYSEREASAGMSPLPGKRALWYCL